MAQASEPSTDSPAATLPLGCLVPERLAAVGRFRGMSPPDAAHARVLEIECGSGEFLLACAESEPGAKFLGIDRSPRKIAMAHQAVARMGLKNIEFRHADIHELQTQDAFDYLIVQRAFDFADDNAREHLWTLCRERLAPQGIAAIGYSTYPGAHVGDMLRDMMRYESSTAQSPAGRMEKARSLLQFLGASLDPERPEDQLRIVEITRLLHLSDDQLREDYLDATRRPVYFQDFAADAHRHSLEIMGDLTMGLRFANYLGVAAENMLEAVTSDAIEKEQYRDVVSNRAFRMALVCHAEVPLNTTPGPASLAELLLQSQLRPEEPEVKLHSAVVERFLVSNGLRIGTGVPLIKAALLHLGEIWPAAIRCDDLVAAAQSKLRALGTPQADEDAGATDRLADNLVQCCLSDIIEVHSRASTFTNKISERPTASALARWQSEHGEVVTNRRLESVRLEHLDRNVLQLLDGTRAHQEIVEALVAWTTEGRIAIYENGRPLADLVRIQQILDEYLLPSLERLAGTALLIA